MQLPDEILSYCYQSLLSQTESGGEWTPAEELHSQHSIPAKRWKELGSELLQVRSQMAQERDREDVPQRQQPLDAGFIDLPQKLLADLSSGSLHGELARIESAAAQLRREADQVVILAAGPAALATRAIFAALGRSRHNELPGDLRLGIPRIYFEGDSFDNDSLQELLELLQATSVNPESRGERWGLVAIGSRLEPLECAAAFRLLRKEMSDLYGSRSQRLRDMTIVVSPGTNSRLRQLCRAAGIADGNLFVTPDRVGDRFAVFSAAGLLPAAVMGLDIRALLLGAAHMTRQFLEEPFERNLALQYAAAGYLMSQELGKPVRLLATWSRKLEALCRWHHELFAASLGKQGRGTVAATAVFPRDQYGTGQVMLQGGRQLHVTRLLVKSNRALPLAIGMEERNEDGLNDLNRTSYPSLTQAAIETMSAAAKAAARPAADLILPSLAEYSIGQLMQMFMLAAVAEGKLLAVNPYSQPAAEACQKGLWQALTRR